MNHRKISPKVILQKIYKELETLTDTRVTSHILKLLIEPHVVMRLWDYGDPFEKYECWTVLVEENGVLGIAYSEFGFGPEKPWGLVRVSDNQSDPSMSMGMDCGWFTCFLDAYFDSAASELPIWRVFKQGKITDPFPGYPITEEADWDSAWKEIYRLREFDKSVIYNIHNSIGTDRCKSD